MVATGPYNSYSAFLSGGRLDVEAVVLPYRQYIYVGESNENHKTEINFRNIAPLSYKLADMLPML
jgi:hypothetical protein